MAVSTFDVDADVVATFFPQFQIRSDGPVDSTKLTAQINNAASYVNGVMIATGLDPVAIDAATTDPAYFNARTLVLKVLGPILAAAAEGHTVSGEEITRLEESRDKALAEFKKRPGDLGVSDTDYAPQVRGSNAYHDLDTSETGRAERNQFQTVVGRNSEANRKIYW